MRKIASEFLGSLLLVAIVIGSGIMAVSVSNDIGIQLLINTVATIFGLAVLIQTLRPISGAHMNPVVSLVELVFKRIDIKTFMKYLVAQFLGAVLGAVVANAMFGRDLVELASNIRSGGSIYLGEIVATAGLILFMNLLLHHNKPDSLSWVIPAWIGSAYFFTSSTSFANPAVTVGRIFSDSFAGIAPSCVPQFVLAQIFGALVGVGLFKVLTNDN